jgi:hypothetical protein
MIHTLPISMLLVPYALSMQFLFFFWHVIFLKIFSPQLFKVHKQGQPDARFRLLDSESLQWLRFVEFDDVNGKVLVYSAQDRYAESLTLVIAKRNWIFCESTNSTYKVFDLKHYMLLSLVSDKNAQEIRSGNLMFPSSCVPFSYVLPYQILLMLLSTLMCGKLISHHKLIS